MSRTLFTLRFVLAEDGTAQVHDCTGPVPLPPGISLPTALRTVANTLIRMAALVEATPGSPSEVVAKLHRWSVERLGGGAA